VTEREKKRGIGIPKKGRERKVVVVKKRKRLNKNNP